MQESQGWIRSAGAMSGITLVSRITGYARDCAQTFFLGAGFSSDAFVIAFRIPNLLRRLVGEGEMTAAFVPVFTRYLQGKDRREIWRFAGAAFYALALILTLITIAGIFLSPLLVRALALGFQADSDLWNLTVSLNRLMFPYILFIGLAALAMAILNSLRSFAFPALSPVLLNLTIIAAALFIAPRLSEPAYGFAIGVLVGGAIQLLYQIPVLARKGMNFRPHLDLRDPGIRKVGRLMIPGLFGAGVTQLNIVIDSQFASWLQPGSVSYLYYAIRVTELALGVFAISVSTVMLPTLSAAAARGQIARVGEILSQALRLIGFITLPATVGLVLLRMPIINVLFERGKFDAGATEQTAYALQFYAVGLFFFAAVKVFAPAFYAFQDMVTPVKIGAVVFLFHIGLNFLLIGPLGHGGVALSTSISAFLNFALLGIFYVRRRGGLSWDETLAGLVRTLAAAAAMGVVILLLEQVWPFQMGGPLVWRAMHLLAVIAAGAAVFVGGAALLGSRELRELAGAFRGRRRGGGEG